MDIVSELIDYTVIAFPDYEAGTNIFDGQILNSTEGIYLIRSGGSFNNYLPVETTYINVYSKYSSAETAITNLEELKRYYHRMHSAGTENAVIYSMLVVGDIDDVSRDDEGYKIFKFTLEVMHRSTDLIS